VTHSRSKAITLTGSDADGDPLTFAIVTGPANGVLSGTAPNVTYTPAANYSGSDSFTFKVNDGTVDSTVATVSITVQAAPLAVPVTVDNTDSAQVTRVGTWTVSTWTGGGAFIGANYLHDGNSGKGSKSVTYRPELAAGVYEVYINYTSGDNRASNVPVTINYDGGSATVTVNQRSGGGVWKLLGTYTFAAGTAGNVVISNAGTSGYVIADAIKFVPVATEPPAYRPADNPANVVNGVEYAYYEGTWSVLPDFSTLISVAEGDCANVDLGLRLRDDNFAFVFRGYVEVPQDGVYTFYTTSDDGSRLYIGGTEVVNNDGAHAAQERSGTIALAAGLHEMAVAFFEATGNQVLEVRYEGPGVTKQLIPDNRLYREAQAQGGTVSEYTDTNGVGWRVHTFTTVGASELTISANLEIEYLIVAGGGSGGGVNWNRSGGGGGAGGFFHGVTNLAASTYSVVVGAGGVKSLNNRGTSGGKSSAFGLTANGGGAGGSNQNTAGIAGGSGGGGASNSGAAGSSNQPAPGLGNNGAAGNNGSNPNQKGGGGGGSTSAGGGDGTLAQRELGGAGFVSAITGTTNTYARGGDGGIRPSSGTAMAVDGDSNTGNGGSGVGNALQGNAAGSNGGSGIVIVRYRM
jgi:hypothetical protein